MKKIQFQSLYSGAVFLKRRSYFIILVFSILLVLCVSSCSKWLDVRPKSQVKENDLFSTEQGFVDALTGVYTLMTNTSLYGDNMTMGFMDALAQRYDISGSSSAFYQTGLYNYQDANVKSTVAGIWNSMYNAIVNDNNILQQIDAQKRLFSGQNYALVKGEALGLRAFMHFDLLRMFGPVYATNPDKICIPYVTTVSLKVTPQLKASVVMDSVIADLKTAEQLLSADSLVDNFTPNDSWLLAYRQNHFNLWAVKALLARVYLYKGDKVNALKYALQVINSHRFSFVQKVALTGAVSTKDRTFRTEHMFSLHIYNLKASVDKYFKYSTGNSYQLTLPEVRLNNIFEIANGGSTDYRYAFLWELDGTIRFPSKLWQESKVVAAYKELMPLLRLPEVYFIAAECTADVPTAVSYLNAVRENRGIAPLPDVLLPDNLQNEIFKSYEKEFYCEGQLWFYYKRRNSKSISGTSIPGSDVIYVFPLPDDEVQFGNRG